MSLYEASRIKLKNVSDCKGIINLELKNRLQLDHCPLCHGENVALVNTHTPSYWIECECGLELHDREHSNLPDTAKGHMMSAIWVIEQWNKLAAIGRFKGGYEN